MLYVVVLLLLMYSMSLTFYSEKLLNKQLHKLHKNTVPFLKIMGLFGIVFSVLVLFLLILFG